MLLEELSDVLGRERFASRLAAANVRVDELIDGFRALSTVTEVTSVEAVVRRDPDDDHVLACAVAADCEVIVSDDDDLISLIDYRAIKIVSSAEFLKTLYL